MLKQNADQRKTLNKCSESLVEHFNKNIRRILVFLNKNEGISPKYTRLQLAQFK